MNIYSLSRSLWDFSFENPDKIKPNHIAVFFYAIEHCNRLGWKEKFGLPTGLIMEATGIKSYNTYINTLNDLVEFEFITLVQKSKNQYSSNIVALSNFDNAPNKALDKAIVNHSTKQSESTIQSTSESIDSINKQIYNNTNIQDYQSTAETVTPAVVTEKILNYSFEDFWKDYDKKVGKIEKIRPKWEKLKDSEREEIKSFIPKYKISQPKKKFRKNPETFLNNESWKDEIIFENDGNEATTKTTGKSIEQNRSDRNQLTNLAGNVLAEIAAKHSLGCS